MYGNVTGGSSLIVNLAMRFPKTAAAVAATAAVVAVATPAQAPATPAPVPVVQTQPVAAKPLPVLPARKHISG